jgi:hypothetical protein
MQLKRLRIRDDFNMRVKRAVSARVALICSNPECRAVTAGPQTSPEKSINIGVAAHISAASPRGPRYNALLTSAERRAIGNAVWLCQNCAKLIDTDPHRFSEAVLLKWKRDAELESKHQLGKKRATKRSSFAADVRRRLVVKRRMERDFQGAVKGTEVIIHSEEDNLYPEFWERPGISNWMKLEFWGFYHNGFEVVLSIESAAVVDDGHWAIEPYKRRDEAININKIKVLQIGRIPFCNVIDYHMNGDEYYRSPHIYCRYANDGMPYEGFVAEIADSPYGERLNPQLEVKFDDIVST